MSSLKKTYFLAPNFDFAPDGLIQLGSIIIDPKRPERSLNKGKQVAIPADEVQRAKKEDWELERSKLKETRVGLWASFLQIVGFGGDVSYSNNRASSEVYKADSLETEFFQPDEAYLFESLKNPMVKEYMEQTWHKSPVYMISGLRLARGFSVETKASTTNEGEAKVGVDLTAVSAPVQVGPEVKIKRWMEENAKFGRSNDCVFAYQLIKIRSRRNDKISQEDYNRGAPMEDQVAEREQSVGTLRDDWELVELEGSSVDIPGLRLDSVQDEEGAEVYIVAKEV